MRWGCSPRHSPAKAREPEVAPLVANIHRRRGARETVRAIARPVAARGRGAHAGARRRRAGAAVRPGLRRLRAAGGGARPRPSRARTSSTVDSDPVLLERILRNLLANAVRYTRRGGIIVGARRRRAACASTWSTPAGHRRRKQARDLRGIRPARARPHRQRRSRARPRPRDRAAPVRAARLPARAPVGTGRGSRFSVAVARAAQRPSPRRRLVAATPASTGQSAARSGAAASPSSTTIPRWSPRCVHCSRRGARASPRGATRTPRMDGVRASLPI